MDAEVRHAGSSRAVEQEAGSRDAELEAGAACSWALALGSPRPMVLAVSELPEATPHPVLPGRQ